VSKHAIVTAFVTIALLAGISGVLSTRPGRAENTPQAVTPPVPTPQPPAVDELLRQSDTAGVWEKVDNNRVHHLQSGLVCEAMFFSMGGQAKTKTNLSALVLPLTSVAIVASDRPRGDDVACNYEAPNGPLVVIEAIRFKPHEDAGDVFSDTVNELGSKFSSFHHVEESAFFSMPLIVEGELGRGLIYRNYEAIFEDKRYLATIWVGPVRGWALIVYAVGTSDNPMLQHIMVDVQWKQAARWILATSISRGESAP
jgi:hypothetical protein